MKVSFVLTAFLIALLGGCGVSQQPFYTAASIVDNPSYAGKWTDDETNWVVTRTSPGHFDIATCDRRHPQQPCNVDTRGVLFRSGSITFLDFQETDDPGLHGLFQVRQKAGGIEMVPLAQDLLLKLARQHRLDTASTILKGDVVLTGPTAALEKFIVRHASDPLVFGDPHLIRRLTK